LLLKKSFFERMLLLKKRFFERILFGRIQDPWIEILGSVDGIQGSFSRTHGARGEGVSHTGLFRSNLGYFPLQESTGPSKKV